MYKLTNSAKKRIPCQTTSQSISSHRIYSWHASFRLCPLAANMYQSETVAIHKTLRVPHTLSIIRQWPSFLILEPGMCSAQKNNSRSPGADASGLNLKQAFVVRKYRFPRLECPLFPRTRVGSCNNTPYL